MAFLPLRRVAVGAEAEDAYNEWIDWLRAELGRDNCDRNELCRRILTEIYYPEYAAAAPKSVPQATRIALLQMDPRNITFEAEYYADIDAEKYARTKPLLWLWEMFDKSPLGENVHLGVMFRRVLAEHIFRRCGKNFKCFHFVKFSYGYNMEVGDGVVVHRHVLLDDRGGISIGDGSSVADYVNIYSHNHSLADGRDVETPQTVLGRNVRVTYHATILAGVHMADDSMLGSMAVATKDIASGEVAIGIPAVPKLKKPKPEDRPKHEVTVDPLAVV
jgi:acetyltransferase-like isoleucine patch superfamily enzyme